MSVLNPLGTLKASNGGDHVTMLALFQPASLNKLSALATRTDDIRLEMKKMLATDKRG